MQFRVEGTDREYRVDVTDTDRFHQLVTCLRDEYGLKCRNGIWTVQLWHWDRLSDAFATFGDSVKEITSTGKGGEWYRKLMGYTDPF